jgi:hypothetical protein
MDEAGGEKPPSQHNKGNNMPDKINGESVPDSFAKLAESMLSLDGVKKVAEWYIEACEKMANQFIEMQEKGTEWAKETPFASLFEAQTSIARKLVEQSAAAARMLWQIPQPNQA